MSEDTRNVLKTYDVIKVVAILLIVLGHVAECFNYIPEFQNMRGANYLLVAFAWYPIIPIYLPVLVAVSGAIYYFSRREMNKYNSNWSFVENKMKRLLIPYAFFAVLIVFPTLYYLDLIRGDVVGVFIKDLLLGRSPKHLWYVLMLFQVFVIFYFIEPFIIELKAWIVWLLFIILNAYSDNFTSYFHINTVMKYLLYFYMGYSFQKNRCFIVTSIYSRYIFVVALVGSVVTFLAYFYCKELEVIRYPLFLISSVLGVLYFYILSNWISKTHIVDTPLCKVLSKSSFFYLFNSLYVFVFNCR